jgi:hypothetical protein
MSKSMNSCNWKYRCLVSSVPTPRDRLDQEDLESVQVQWQYLCRESSPGAVLHDSIIDLSETLRRIPTESQRLCSLLSATRPQ